MATPDVEKAIQFLAANARVIDQRRYERLFEGGAAQPVRDALAAYRNGDGGFGYALEPDGRAPTSEPIAAEVALHLMDETDVWDTDIVAGVLGWLAADIGPKPRPDTSKYFVARLLGPRPDFARTLSTDEMAMMMAHVRYWQPLLDAGKVIALGGAAKERAQALPDLPSIHEQGVTGFDGGARHGIVAPANTRPEVVNKLA